VKNTYYFAAMQLPTLSFFFLKKKNTTVHLLVYSRYMFNIKTLYLIGYGS